jgi:hypothetical protein
MDVKVLRASNKTEFAEWRKMCDSLPENDIFFYPNYAEVYEFNNEGEACCFMCKKGDHDFILYPFLKRRIKQIEIFKDTPGEYFDIISPYGYGGYLKSGRCSIEITDFYSLFQRFCEENSIVSEFVRFHPWLNTEEGCRDFLNLKAYNKVVAVDVAKGDDEIWMELDCKCKNRIRKSEKSGVVVKQDSSTIDEFYKLYTLTMDRNRASGYYYFSREFFENMIEKLSGNMTFFNAYLDNKIIASILVLYNKFFTHAHLAGTDPGYLHFSPIMTLFYRTSLWANNRGSKFLILGGGRTASPDDCLFRIKKRFSRETYDFCIGTKIHNKEVYDHLCRVKEEYSGTQNNNGFFPKYRDAD